MILKSRRFFIPPLPQHSSLTCRNRRFYSPMRSKPSLASCETYRCGIFVSLCCFVIGSKLTVNSIRPILWPAGRVMVKLRKPRRILTQILVSSSHTGALTLHCILARFPCLDVVQLAAKKPETFSLSSIIIGISTMMNAFTDCEPQDVRSST
jgi:hypothetical protein